MGKKIIEKSRQERAVELFKKGFNCSQAVFTAYADLYGFDEETALKMSASFGGGLGRMREVCGCVSAMAMVAGFETGSTRENDPAGKEHNYEVVQRMADRYKEIAGGSIICRELLGLSTKESEALAPKPAERTEQYYRKRPCMQLVCDACSIIENEFMEVQEK